MPANYHFHSEYFFCMMEIWITDNISVDGSDGFDISSHHFNILKHKSVDFFMRQKLFIYFMWHNPKFHLKNFSDN